MKTLAMILLCFFASGDDKEAGKEIFDIEKYMGDWYEIARYDHSFEKGLSHVKTATGRAKMPDPSRPHHLRVSFFLWFYSDYDILYIDPEYRYALIGSSSDKYLWILSRTPSISDDVKKKILDTAHSKGYDTSRLIWVEQG